MIARDLPQENVEGTTTSPHREGGLDQGKGKPSLLYYGLVGAILSGNLLKISKYLRILLVFVAAIIILVVLRKRKYYAGVVKFDEWNAKFLK